MEFISPFLTDQLPFGFSFLISVANLIVTLKANDPLQIRGDGARDERQAEDARGRRLRVAAGQVGGRPGGAEHAGDGRPSADRAGARVPGTGSGRAVAPATGLSEVDTQWAELYM